MRKLIIVAILLIANIYQANTFISASQTTQHQARPHQTPSFEYPKSPTWSPDGSMIAFTTGKENENRDIWLISADGGEPTPFAVSDLDEHTPSWSPDGTMIAYEAWAWTDYVGTVIAPLDGGEAIQIFESDFAIYNPRWSPDGEFLLLNAENAEGNRQLRVVAKDGSNQMNLVSVTDNSIIRAKWSPDGKYIIWDTVDLTSALWLINWQTQETTQLLDRKAFDYQWSLDGKFLAYILTDINYFDDIEAPNQIWLYEVATGERTLLMEDDNILTIRWSPDNRTLLASDHKNIYLIDTQTTTDKQIPLNFTVIMNQFEVAWSPDGQYIAFVGDNLDDGLDNYDIYVTDPAGQNVMNLTQRPDDLDSQPQWSPDSTRILFRSYKDTDALIAGEITTWLVDVDGSNLTPLVH